MSNSRTIVFVGTYNRGKGPGIHTFELDHATGSLRKIAETSDITNPSFLVLRADQRFLYTVCDLPGTGGSIAAFAVDPSTFALRLINTQPSHGKVPCHLSVDPAGRSLFVANYGDGAVASYPLATDGSIRPAGTVYQHQGTSVDASRQEGPHAHSITLDPAGRFVFVADLGTDEILGFKVDHAAGKMTPNEPFATKVTPGAGPRHFAFAPSGKHAYVINELDSTVIVYDYDATSGRLAQRQIVSTRDPAKKHAENYPAEVRISDDGRFLYGSNRRHENIVVFAIRTSDGTLTLVQHQSTHISEPRHFNLTPQGDYLISGNQSTNSLALFRVDRASGALHALDALTPVPVPVCIQFLSSTR